LGKQFKGKDVFGRTRCAPTDLLWGCLDFGELIAIRRWP
jgi:hypothetical protein